MNTNAIADLPELASLHIRAMITAASRQTGRGKMAMLADWAWRFLWPKGMLIDEYFNLSLYDLDRSGRDPRETYVGYAEGRRINRAMCADDHGQRGYLNDKRLYAAMLTGYGLAVPITQAVVHATMRLPDEHVMRDPGDLAQWLLTQARYPLFGKPIRGANSVGALSLDAADAATGLVTQIGGQKRPAIDLATEICAKHAHGGYLLMDRLRPVAEMRAIAGEALGSVRIVTLTENGAARALYALWKVPAVDAVADAAWRGGNMLADLDAETGTVRGVSRGQGFTRTTFTSHPQTGAVLVGQTLPGWDAALALVSRAAELTPRVGLIGWDLALTDDGPVIIEANGGANHSMYQIATGRGFLTTGIGPAYAAARAANLRKSGKAQRRRRIFGLARAYAANLRRDILKRDFT